MLCLLTQNKQGKYMANIVDAAVNAGSFSTLISAVKTVA
jgi:uncharacterized surface protein with fasciclin (FAS1) repeats